MLEMIASLDEVVDASLSLVISLDIDWIYMYKMWNGSITAYWRTGNSARVRLLSSAPGYRFTNISIKLC